MREVEILPITSIKVKDRARQDLGDIDALAISIQQKGLIQPITINQFGELLAGERRLRAHEVLGFETIRCLRRETKGKVDKLEVELFENIHRKDMTWQERNELVRQIHELQCEKDAKWTQLKTGEVLGISDAEVNRSLELAESMELIPDLKEAKSETDAFKALSMLKEGRIRGELQKRIQSKELVKDKNFKHKSKTYRTGDALKGLKAMKVEQFDFAEVDPPYGVELQGHKNASEGQRGAMLEYHEVKPKDYKPFLHTLCEQVFRVLKDDTYAIFWYGFEWHCILREELQRAGFKVTAVPAVWLKSVNGGMASQPDITLSQGYEQFIVARKGEPKLGKPGRGNIFDYRPVSPALKLHPTEKPIELMKDILDTFCIVPGSKVICPFLGSGVTILAAFERGHEATGWDMSPKFKAKFEERLYEWAETRNMKEMRLDQIQRLEEGEDEAIED